MPDYAKEVKCNDIISTGKRYYKESLRDILEILKKYGVKIATINSIITILTSLCSGGMTIFLFSRVWSGVYGIADFSALTSSSRQLEGVLNTFFNTLSSFYSNSLEIDNFKFVYFYKNTNKLSGNKLLDAREPYRIEVKNLWFKYPNSREFTLRDISFVIEQGQKISIVGLNGSGKTTLIKLILGLYPASKGDIYINGISIYEYSTEELQEKISVVFQDDHVYAYSIKENIAFENGIQDASLDLLEKLGIHQKIKTLSNGFETILSKEFDKDGYSGSFVKTTISNFLMNHILPYSKYN